MWGMADICTRDGGADTFLGRRGHVFVREFFLLRHLGDAGAENIQQGLPHLKHIVLRSIELKTILKDQLKILDGELGISVKEIF